MKSCGMLIMISLLSPALVLGASGPGDLTCDGVVDFDDIDPFVAALGCPGGDPNCWPGPCPWINGDCNDDGEINFDDIDPFVALIGTVYPDPEGACCFADGTCVILTAADCADAGGVYEGDDTGCDPNPCPQPEGACCYSDGSCELTVEMDCTGDWQGADSDCDPNPCPQPGSPTVAEIAGNSLSEYPYFEYVRAFNEDAPLQIALDPTRYPGIVGQTADLYVVEAQTKVEWQLNPTLNDVTSDGPLTVTFGGGTIQANTFTVASAFELDSSVFQAHTGAYTGLGHGYDVIVDIDQDGQLGGADYIDGLSDEAGLYIVHDTAQGGPLAVTETIYSGGSWLDQDLYYPSNIGNMGQLPLIIVSHGNGHNYQWYDHIGNHMASYGYIVMSHSNQTGPGIETASTTTLTNTDYLLGNLGSIAGGALNGHVDSHRIMWIGHSRGAEGITRAYDRLFDGSYSPSHFTIDDIILLSSMLPTDFLKTSSSNPHDANYHLWTASGDADVNGSAGCDLCQTFHLHDRATRYRQSTVVQGTGHGDFHASSGSVFSGPCHITPKSAVHAIMNGYFLPLAAHYMQGNVPGHDFLWRQYERFHPIGVDISNPCVVVSNEYRNGAETGNVMIDDYQTQTSVGVSSSGGAVTYTVQNLQEGRLDDNNSSFSWSSSDPFNGATQCSSEGSDNSRGVVFDWNGSDRYYEWELLPALQDVAGYRYLSLRGAQGTRHPYTLAVAGDLTFSVTLHDTGGTSSSIHIGTYGGGLEQPYDRSSGWHNEMEVVRIRLTDFLTNGSGLDLTSIEAIRLDVGPSWGSDEGRIVVDELMLTNDVPPPIPGAISIGLPDGAPAVIPPGVPTTVSVLVSASGESYVADSGQLHYRYDGGSFVTTPLVSVGGGFFEATLPAPDCGDVPEFYFSAEGTVSGLVTNPADAPATVYMAEVGELVSIVAYDFESNPSWTVSGDATDGQWDRGVPVNCSRGDPPTDFDGSGQCFLTDNSAASDCNSDVDGGTTTLTSQVFDLTGLSDPIVSYARWYSNTFGASPEADIFEVEVSGDGGSNWIELETVGPTGTEVGGGWYVQSFRIADYVTPTAQFRIRFHASDLGDGSVIEAGIDAFAIDNFQCE